MPAARRRLFTTLFTLFSLLFMQLALAGYACPGAESRVRQAAAMAEAGMPCAGDMTMAMDVEEPALCHVHCDAGQQANDSQPAQPPAMVLAGGLAIDPVPPSAPHGSAPQATLLARATAPPLAIRNCCLRI